MNDNSLNTIVVVEDCLFCCRKVKDGKVYYYLKGIKHYKSGKTFTWVQFINEYDYSLINAKFDERFQEDI